jgi:putative aldouronate transport system permease protein
MKGLRRFGSNLAYDFKYSRALLVMILPVLIYLIIFNYLPMAGAVIAFKQYNFSQGIFGSPWCGLNNFRFFFMSGKAWQVTSNTVLYNAAFIITQNVLEIAAAIFLSEIGNRRFKKFTQGAMFLPNFISWVVVAPSRTICSATTSAL